MSRPAFPPVAPGFRIASLIGGALASLLFLWVLLVGRTELTAAPTSDFYDLQARAWFDGDWHVEDVTDPVTGESYNPLSIEAFVVEGRSYMYFGPVPSMLRVPVLASTDTLDGELTQPSMFVAFLVALWATHLLSWRIRVLVRGSEPVGRVEQVVAGATLGAVGGGTVLLYLGSQPVVYHEAALWGVAFALLSYHAAIEVVSRATPRAVVTAGVFAGLALHTRASVGLGPVVALALLSAVTALRAFGGERFAWATRWSLPRDVHPPGGTVALLAAVTVLPVLVYAAVNMARFDEPFRLPIEKQVFSGIDPNRIAALEDNSGSIFGLRYLPTTAWQYLRPDALEIDAVLPWVNFPRDQATVVGDVVFDTRDEASSVPATMPVLAVMAIVGVVAVARSSRRPDLMVLRLPLIGAACGCLGVLAIAFIAHRYLVDFLPLLLLAGLAGLHVAFCWMSGRGSRAAQVCGVGLALLAVWGLAANLALAVEYQRVIAPVEPSTRWAFLEVQHGAALETTTWDSAALPDPTGSRGRVLSWVQDGSCAVVWTDGFEWTEVPEADCDVSGPRSVVRLGG